MRRRPITVRAVLKKKNDTRETDEGKKIVHKFSNASNGDKEQERFASHETGSSTIENHRKNPFNLGKKKKKNVLIQDRSVFDCEN